MFYQSRIGYYAQILGRINFFAISSSLVGIAGLGLGVLMFSGDNEGDISYGLIVVVVSTLLLIGSFYIYKQKKNIIKNINNLDYIKKHLARMSFITVLLAFAVSPLLLYGLKIVGLFAVVYFINITWNTAKSYYLLSKYLNYGKIKKENMIRKIKPLIYPKVNHNIRWHRFVTVIGWIISVFSFGFIFIIFPIYFGLIQRIIYFVAYGEDKNKWMR